jgi:MoxR-like ATPase
VDPADRFADLRARLSARVLGQPVLADRLLIALLADGHLLVEGPPGLAKTRAVRSLAGLIDADFHRLQFTPDLLPADLTGTEIFRPQDGSFRFEKGPIFHSILLADEINRAPAKVQSALLEAMAERQVTVGQASYALPELFLVMATQNPLEHEGVYPLPEAQLDRFLIHVRVGYPDATTERAIMELALSEARAALPRADDGVMGSDATPVAIAPLPEPCVSPARIFAARREVLDVHVAEAVADYIVRLVAATRDPSQFFEGGALAAPDIGPLVDYGASPRATLALARAARARAWLDGRDYVTPFDVQDLAPDVLRHRIAINYAHRVGGLTPDRLVDRLIERVPAP